MNNNQLNEFSQEQFELWKYNRLKTIERRNLIQKILKEVKND